MAVKNVVLKIGAKGVKGTVKGLKSVAGGLTSIGKKAAIVSGGFAILSTKLAGDFQKGLMEVTTLMKGTTENTLKNLGKELTSVANASGLALDSLTKAKYDIVSAGFSNAADSAIVLEQATKLAVGGVTTAAGAADILTSALNAFGEGADQADEVSDALFTTVRLGKTTITELGASLGQVLPFAKSFNLSLESVGASMATLTAAGINTAESTTALKGAIVALESPSKGAKDAMKSAGIEVKRFDDGTVDLLKTVSQFEGLSADTISKLIPNVRAQLALKTMVNNIGSLSDNLEEFEDTTGATETAFGKMLKAFNTQMSILKNNFQTVFIEIGNVIIEKIQPHIETLNKEFKKLNEIGFDNLAKALGDQLPIILENISKAFKIAMLNISGQIDVLGLKFQNLITPFDDMSEQIKTIQTTNEETFRMSIDTIGLMFKNMYNDIVTKASEAKAKQDELNKSTEKGQEKTKETLKRGTKILELRKGEMDLGIEVAKVTTNNIVSQNELLKLKQDQLQAELKGAILSGQSAKDAMKSVVRAKTMEGVVGLMASIFKSVAYPLNLILAAGAGAAVGEVVDTQLARFADGGIVQGNASQGDVVPVMATAGELILNQAQQNNLAGGMGGITINIGGNMIGEESFVRDTLIPEIERAQVLA
jgi:TP901 family phage tail tape measure protein